MAFELREARLAWESEGRTGLERFLARYKDATGNEGNLADSEGLALSRRQHEFMIELLKVRDNWALAQLWVFWIAPLSVVTTWIAAVEVPPEKALLMLPELA